MDIKETIMFCDFFDKKAVSVYSKDGMKTFIVDPSSKEASGKEVRYIPNEDLLVNEVNEYLRGAVIVTWDSRKLKSWKLKNDVVDLRDYYKSRVKPLSLRLEDVAVNEEFAHKEELIELDHIFKVYQEGHIMYLLDYNVKNAYWCAKLEEKYHFLDLPGR
jgi:hypothetical protein